MSLSVSRETYFLPLSLLSHNPTSVRFRYGSQSLKNGTLRMVTMRRQLHTAHNFLYSVGPSGGP